MGTRGCYGFRKNGVDKLTYNHFDSYPDYLGEIMVKFCKETSIKELNEIFDKIILVNELHQPTAEQIEECKEFYNGSVASQSPDDWYCLLREAQGNPDAYKNGLKYMTDCGDFIKDSLFCEYAYIINLDANCLEFWVGFQKEPDSSNRYGKEDDRGYYPCKMVSYYRLEPEYMDQRSIEEYVADMEKMSREEETDYA